jgi:hypothetical protein
VLDLGHQERPPPAALAEVAHRQHVAGGAHEGHGHRVHAQLQAEGQVAPVAGGEGRDAAGGARQVQALPAAQRAAVHHAALGSAFDAARHAQLELTVGQAHQRARPQPRDGPRGLDRQALGRAGRVVLDQLQQAAGAQARGVALQQADAHLGAGEVLQDGHRQARLGRGAAHRAHQPAVPGVAAVAEVEAHHVDAGAQQAAQHGGRGAGRAQRGHDARAALRHPLPPAARLRCRGPR